MKNLRSVTSLQGVTKSRALSQFLIARAGGAAENDRESLLKVVDLAGTSPDPGSDEAGAPMGPQSPRVGQIKPWIEKVDVWLLDELREAVSGSPSER